jgi:hypothetical protein
LGSIDADEDTTWESNPFPLMVKHPPRVTVSNTKIPPDLFEGRERFRMGPTATKVVAMARKDRMIIGVDTRGSNHHDTVIQNGMDNHERDMEPPPKGLGSYPRHTRKDPGLMQNSRKSGGNERFLPHETPPSDHQTTMPNR